ncbi:hypothetical protein CCB80_08975 [Armatimonadetes bacterium Uphvl-Ar1]|nr:hypothetical protein CCB80_08975 [Armatimonadetes bacterium Uphvl-Ar1]
MKNNIVLMGAVALTSIGQAQFLNPTVHYDFNNTLEAAGGGNAAQLRNTGGVSGLGSAASATFSAGVTLADGSTDTVLAMNQFDFFVVNHLIPANGGGGFVNQYSILMDIELPTENTWVSLYQTSTANTNDGDYWIRNTDSLFGVSGNYTGTTVVRNQWNRIILSVDLTTSTINTYLNGTLARTQGLGGVDGRHSLDTSILAFADNDGEMPSSMRVANWAIYDGAMSAENALALGVASSSIEAVPEPATMVLVGLAAAAVARRNRKN